MRSQDRSHVQGLVSSEEEETARDGTSAATVTAKTGVNSLWHIPA